MTEPEQYILDNWDWMCTQAHRQLQGECPLGEDETLVEMHKYIHELNRMLDIAWDAVTEAGYEGFNEELRDFMEGNNNIRYPDTSKVELL